MNPQALPLGPPLSDIVTHLKLENWAMELSTYPDEQIRLYILSGIEKGFRIGYDCANHRLVSRDRNMSSVVEHSEIVDHYLDLEKAQGVLPSNSLAAKACHVSPFGVIPKKSKPGKWQLIIHFSTPNGHSVNDGIEKELCSLPYVSQ